MRLPRCHSVYCQSRFSVAFGTFYEYVTVGVSKRFKSINPIFVVVAVLGTIGYFIKTIHNILSVLFHFLFFLLTEKDPFCILFVKSKIFLRCKVLFFIFCLYMICLHKILYKNVQTFLSRYLLTSFYIHFLIFS